jgi:predicted TIM-barrel fold metal-dependent hydrolase
MERAPPPDPAPVPPRLQAPAQAWDCHFHLFGPAARFGFHPASQYVSDDRPPAEAFALHDRLGLARGLAVSAAGYGTDSRQLEAALAEAAGRYLGVVLLPDDTPAAEFRRLDAAGMRGIRFVNPRHGGPVPPISEVNARRAADRGWAIHYYPYAGELAAGTAHLEALPGQLVIDHFGHLQAAPGAGQPGLAALQRLMDGGRTWVKLSGPMRLTRSAAPYPDVSPLARALVAHRPDRLLWGSDWPHLNLGGAAMPNDATLLDLLADWAPDPADRAAILAENPARLIGG